MTAPRIAPGGFTLVEVMVAMTILSLVMLVTITGLRTLGSTQLALERTTQRVDEVRTVSSFLRDTLESAVAGTGAGGLTLGGGEQNASRFRILPQAVEWQSVVLFGESFGGSYLLRMGREEDQLVLRWLERGAGKLSRNWGSAPSRMLVSNVDEFQISYRREFDGDWRSEWDQAGMPPLLKLQIRAAGRYWPDLVFRLGQ